jgi:hypothetical protein
MHRVGSNTGPIRSCLCVTSQTRHTSRLDQVQVGRAPAGGKYWLFIPLRTVVGKDFLKATVVGKIFLKPPAPAGFSYADCMFPLHDVQFEGCRGLQQRRRQGEGGRGRGGPGV